MKPIIGVVMMVASVVLGLYVGVYLMFVGGIAGLINIVADVAKGGDINGMAVALNIARVMFAGFVGVFSGLALFMSGMALLNE